MADLQVRVAADVASAISALQKLEKELDRAKLGAEETARSTESAARAFQKLPNATGQATSTLTNFSRVVQDAPFGLIGIANNIDPLVTSFQQLKATTGTTGGALKALVGQLAGPAGIALAISTVTSLLIAFGGNLFKSGQAAKAAKSDIEDFNKSLDNAKASALSSGLQLQQFVEIAKNGNLPLQQRNEALNQANEILGNYGQKLDLVNVSTNKATVLVEQYTQALLNQALANAFADRAATLLLRQAEAQQKVTEAQLEYKRAQDAVITNIPKLTTKDIEFGRGQIFIIEREKALKKLNDRQKEYKDITNELTNVTTLFNEKSLEATKFFGKFRIPKIPKSDVKIDFDLIPGISNLSEFEAKLANLFGIGGLKPNLDKAIKVIQTKPKEVKVPVRPRLQAIGTDEAVLEFSTQLTQALQNALQSGLEGIGESLGSLLSGENFGEGILNVISSLLTAIGKALIAYGIAKEGIDRILGPAGIAIPGAAAIGLGIASIAAASLLKNFGGPRAEGGPVSGNKTYLVGERGPELFVPNVAGTIVPNDELPSFGQGLASVLGGRGGGGTTLRGQDIILAYARTQRSQLRVNG